MMSWGALLLAVPFLLPRRPWRRWSALRIAVRGVTAHYGYFRRAEYPLGRGEAAREALVVAMKGPWR